MDISLPPVNADEEHAVIETLYELQKSKKNGVRFKKYDLPWISCVSWTMLEHMYKKKNLYPTQARGLFTYSTDDGKHRALVRGYDKFFNINETEATHWSALTSDTKGPYEVTAKENGCIIFVAAQNEKSVVVTSKHSIPEIKDDENSHAGIGYRWVLKHLASVGKCEEDLARWLYNMQVTLVTELCDDAFEEHILPYRDLARGLYLHGINHNRVTLYTLPMAQVQQIAREFGQHSVEYDVLPDIAAVKAAGAEMQKTCRFKGREVEGAVVRCKRLSDGADFFFKIKNEEYLVYREYREITKQVLQITPSTDENTSPTLSLSLDKRPRCRYAKSPYYLFWLKERIVDKPEWFLEYNKNKNIIAVREAFEKDWEDGRFKDLKEDPTELVEMLPQYQ